MRAKTILMILLVILAAAVLAVVAQAAAASTPRAYLPMLGRIATPTPSGPTLAGCPLQPSNNIWNAPVDTLPVHARSAQYISAIGLSAKVHADFGSGTWDGGPIGIPFTTAPSNQALAAITFYYPDESNPGPYPIPSNAPREWGSDHHVLVLQTGTCKLYEVYDATKVDATHWTAGSGAIFDLNLNVLRHDGWTSADAAGLPILPGLVRYDEVAAGEIRHALRVTAPTTQDAYIWPARHKAGSTNSLSYPPMGLRLRLKAGYNISGFSPQAQVILRALKKYGLLLADNGSPWYISGAPDSRWNNDVLHELDVVKGADFEAVDESGLMLDPNSGAVRP